MKVLVAWHFLIGILSITLASDVVPLYDKTYKSFLESHPVVMIKFYSKNCPHCKAFEPIYEKAAQDIKEKGRPFVLAQVDTDKEFITSDVYEIRELPTIKLFIQGNPIQPNYERGGDPILDYIEKSTKHLFPSMELFQISEIMQILNSTKRKVFFVYGNSSEVNVHSEVAPLFPDIEFYHISGDVARRVFPENPATPTVVFLKPYDEKRSYLTSKIDKDTLSEFIKDNMFPRIRDFDQHTVGSILNPKGKKGVILYSKSSVDINTYQEFHKVATAMKSDSIYFIHADINEPLAKKISRMVGVEEADTPIIVLVERKKELEVFHYEGKFHSGEISRYIEDWMKGKLEKWAKSEAEPKDTNELVRTIVGKTFKRDVLDSPKSFVLAIVSSRSSESKQVEDVLKKVAPQLQTLASFGIIDGTKNDIKQYNAKKFPQLIFFPKNKKERPIIFEGESSEINILKFIQAHSEAPKTDL